MVTIIDWFGIFMSLFICLSLFQTPFTLNLSTTIIIIHLIRLLFTCIQIIGILLESVTYYGVNNVVNKLENSYILTLDNKINDNVNAIECKEITTNNKIDKSEDDNRLIEEVHTNPKNNNSAAEEQIEFELINFTDPEFVEESKIQIECEIEKDLKNYGNNGTVENNGNLEKLDKQINNQFWQKYQLKSP